MQFIETTYELITSYAILMNFSQTFYNYLFCKGLSQNHHDFKKAFVTTQLKTQLKNGRKIILKYFVSSTHQALI